MKEKIYVYKYNHGGAGPAPCVGSVMRTITRMKLRILHSYENCSIFLGGMRTTSVAQVGTFRRTVTKVGPQTWRTYLPSFHHLPIDLDTTDTQP